MFACFGSFLAAGPVIALRRVRVYWHTDKTQLLEWDQLPTDLSDCRLIAIPLRRIHCCAYQQEVARFQLKRLYPAILANNTVELNHPADTCNPGQFGICGSWSTHQLCRSYNAIPAALTTRHGRADALSSLFSRSPVRCRNDHGKKACAKQACKSFAVWIH